VLNIVDLFSGAGGLTEGFRLKKYFNFICHVEMDKDACSSLELRNIYYYLKHRNNLEYYYNYIQNNISKDELYKFIPKKIVKDILNIEISKQTIPVIFNFIDTKLKGKSVDGIIGGPPCQAYSLVGRVRNEKKKLTDERIYLYKYYLDFLKKYNPKFFIFENVKGLLSFKDVEGEFLFPKIIKEFNNCGYSIEYNIIDVAEYGVSQKRERLILIGYRNDLNIKVSFFKYLSKYKETAPLLKELLSDLPQIEAGKSFDKYIGINFNEVVRKYIRDNKEIILTQHVARLSSFLDRYKALDYNSVSHTIVAHISKDGHYYIHPDLNQNRSITVREAARIQGFSDDFYFEHSRTAAFKQIGNAVPPILSKKIAISILELLKDIKK